MTPSSHPASPQRRAGRIAPAAFCLLLLAFTLPACAGAATVLAGPGSGPGQVNVPVSTAVDPSSGTLYVGENGNFRVGELDPAKPAGERFIRAFGWGVRDGAEELQTCTALTGCLAGKSADHNNIPITAAGRVNPVGMAVDPATHDLYVSDANDYRVEEFTPAGEFVLTFGHEVDKTTHADVCTAASHHSCGAGVVGSGPGAFGHTLNTPFMPLAFDPAGHLWVGDVDRLEEFSTAGAFLSEVALPGEGSISGLAVDQAGNFYTLGESGGGLTASTKVRRYDSAGSALDFTSLGTNALGEGGYLALALDGSGHLYVGQEPSSSPYRFLEFDQETGQELEAFGAGEVVGHPGQNLSGAGGAIALGASSLYAAGGVVQSFALPPVGPLSRSLSAHPVRGTSATLNAILDAEGAEAHYRFQYLTQQQFEADGNHFGAGAQETPVATIPASFEEPEVSAPISSLIGETEYRFRLLAENVNGKGNTEEVQATFSTAPPVRIDSLYSSAVSAASAIANAQIDPIGTASVYRFEYLTEAAYQENIGAGLDPFSGAQAAPRPDGQLGPAEEDLTVSETLQGLVPGTTYRYRVTAANSGGSRSSSALSFTTQTPGPLSLLDDRGWELVSPPDKHGALFEPIAEAGVVRAAADGSAISYLSSNPTEAGPPGYTNQAQVLSARGSSGWRSDGLSLPYRRPTGLSVGVGQEYRFFSEDLSHAVVEPFFPADLAAISPEATEVTPFLRTDFPSGAPTDTCGGGCYRPILTGAEGVADVPPGTRFAMESPGVPCTKGICGAHLRDAGPNSEHVLLESQVGLTEIPGDEGGLYEWSAAAPPSESLQLVSVLPNGKPAKRVGNGFEFQISAERNAISGDGSSVVWGQTGGHLYLRDVRQNETVQIDANQGGSGAGPAGAVFQGASSDGSRIFFTDQQALVPGAGAEGHKPDLYECRVDPGEGPLRCALSDLTPESAGEPANVQGLALGFSADGSSIYFLADGVLAENVGADGSHASPGICGTSEVSQAPSSTCNLYAGRDGSLSFVAKLASDDSPDWGTIHPEVNNGAALPGLTARVSPNGEWLAFMSRRPLTGYDNHDAATGEADEEVFLYHAGAASLACASCNPTGARPQGVEYAQIETNTGHLAGGDRVWPGTTRLAANIPGWTPYASGLAVQQARYLSDGGRLFFNSSDALAPRDSNRAEDVYEYEPPAAEGPADSCSAADPTFSARAGGCIALISSGTSGEESAFLDASESGEDVFFLTAARLAPRDEDNAVDVYDARVGGGEPQPTQPVQCEGDGCQQPATPPVDATPGSLTFNGAGNVKECPKGRVEKNGKCVAKKSKKAKHHKKKAHKKQKRASSRHGGHK